MAVLRRAAQPTHFSILRVQRWHARFSVAVAGRHAKTTGKARHDEAGREGALLHEPVAGTGVLSGKMESTIS